MRRAGTTGATSFLWIFGDSSTVAERNPVQGEIVQLKIFGGLSSQEIADLLMMGESTVRLHWTMAKAWLRNEVSHDATSLGAR